MSFSEKNRFLQFGLLHLTNGAGSFSRPVITHTEGGSESTSYREHWPQYMGALISKKKGDSWHESTILRCNKVEGFRDLV